MFLIDGDVLVYECGWAAQRKLHTIEWKGKSMTFEWADLKAYAKKEGFSVMGKNAIHREIEETVESEETAINILRGRLKWIAKVMKGQGKRRLFLSGPGNFREEIATLKPYKGNRDDKPRPVHYKFIKQWMIDEAGAELIHGMEADDALAIAQTEANGGDVICSIDKDLMMVPGKFYNWGKKRKDGKTGIRFKVSPDRADEWFWRQMLMGDSTDNIPGIKGFGPVKAEKELKGVGIGKRPKRVAEHYKRQYAAHWREAMTEVGQLLWMCRTEEQALDPDKRWNTDWFNL